MNRATPTGKFLRGATVVLLAGLIFGPPAVQGLSLILLVAGAVVLNKRSVSALRSSVRVTVTRTDGTADPSQPTAQTARPDAPAPRAQAITPPAAPRLPRRIARPLSGESEISPDAVSERVFGKRD